jgi:hypothetical protein
LRSRNVGGRQPQEEAVLSPLGRQPDTVGPDLTAVVDRILDLDRPQ